MSRLALKRRQHTPPRNLPTSSSSARKDRLSQSMHAGLPEELWGSPTLGQKTRSRIQGGNRSRSYTADNIPRSFSRKTRNASFSGTASEQGASLKHSRTRRPESKKSNRRSENVNGTYKPSVSFSEETLKQMTDDDIHRIVSKVSQIFDEEHKPSNPYQGRGENQYELKHHEADESIRPSNSSHRPSNKDITTTGRPLSASRHSHQSSHGEEASSSFRLGPSERRSCDESNLTTSSQKRNAAESSHLPQRKKVASNTSNIRDKEFRDRRRPQRPQATTHESRSRMEIPSAPPSSQASVRRVPETEDGSDTQEEIKQRRASDSRPQSANVPAKKTAVFKDGKTKKGKKKKSKSDRVRSPENPPSAEKYWEQVAATTDPEEQIHRLMKYHTIETKSMKSKHRAELQDMKRYYEEKLNSLQERQKEVDEMNASQFARMQENYEYQIQKLKKLLETETKRLNQARAALVHTAQLQTSSDEEMKGNDWEEHTSHNISTEQLVHELTKRVTVLQRSIQRKESELATMHRKLTDSNKRVKKLEEENERLRKPSLREKQYHHELQELKQQLASLRKIVYGKSF